MKFKLTIYPAVDDKKRPYKIYKFETAAEMVAAQNTFAEILIFLQDEARVMKDYSNMFVMEELIDGEWEEY